MELIKKDIIIGRKNFPGRIHVGESPEYLFVTHHGLISTNSSYHYFENYIDEKAIVVSYDARVNGANKMRASRMSSTYVRDLNDVIKWAKKEYPNLKVVTMGSSWGAAVVIQHAKAHPESIYKSVSWSIPFNMFGSTASKAVIDKSKDDSKTKVKGEVKETTPAGYAWRYALMLPFNINTKSYTKVDINKTVNNKAFNRLASMNKPKPIPVKLFYACFKSVKMVIWNLKKIAKREENKVLYFQSRVDSYLRQKDLVKLEHIKPGKGLTMVFIDKGHHALHWEKEDGLNIKIFDQCLEWIKKAN